LCAVELERRKMCDEENKYSGSDRADPRARMRVSQCISDRGGTEQSRCFVRPDFTTPDSVR